MKDERMKVLQMIEDGKITADEGAKLIKVLNSYGESTQKIKKVAKDVKTKITEIAKDAEPKVKSATKTVLKTTGVVVDELGKNIKDIVSNKNRNNVIIPEDNEDIFEYADYVDAPVEDEVVVEEKANNNEVTSDDVVEGVVIEPVSDEKTK